MRIFEGDFIPHRGMEVTAVVVEPSDLFRSVWLLIAQYRIMRYGGFPAIHGV